MKYKRFLVVALALFVIADVWSGDFGSSERMEEDRRREDALEMADQKREWGKWKYKADQKREFYNRQWEELKRELALEEAGESKQVDESSRHQQKNILPEQLPLQWRRLLD